MGDKNIKIKKLSAVSDLFNLKLGDVVKAELKLIDIEFREEPYELINYRGLLLYMEKGPYAQHCFLGRSGENILECFVDTESLKINSIGGIATRKASLIDCFGYSLCITLKNRHKSNETDFLDSDFLLRRARL